MPSESSISQDKVSADPHSPEPGGTSPPEVFISYARRDYDKVRPVVERLVALGVSCWLDQEGIEGGANYARAIARAIKQSRVFVLMCSDAALHSRNVNKEIMLAWRYARPYLPLLIEPVDSFPEQLEYFLEGCQWIEVFDRPAEEWVPRVRRALASVAVDASAAPPALARADLTGLRSLASFNDRIWPVAADSIPKARQLQPTFRDMGGRPQHQFKVGSRLGLAVEADRAGYLLLLDEGPGGNIYCLCPSWFAPDTRIGKGVNYLPQPAAPYESFQLSNGPGREQLLAVITDEPLGLDWLPPDSRRPARPLDAQDVELLLIQLHQLDPTSWVALATYFDVVR